VSDLDNGGLGIASAGSLLMLASAALSLFGQRFMRSRRSLSTSLVGALALTGCATTAPDCGKYLENGTARARTARRITPAAACFDARGLRSP
jgi:hypothetical protein